MYNQTTGHNGAYPKVFFYGRIQILHISVHPNLSYNNPKSFEISPFTHNSSYWIPLYPMEGRAFKPKTVPYNSKTTLFTVAIFNVLTIIAIYIEIFIVKTWITVSWYEFSFSCISITPLCAHWIILMKEIKNGRWARHCYTSIVQCSLYRCSPSVCRRNRSRMNQIRWTLLFMWI